MYIIAIGWLWVAFMMAITETGVVAGLATFLFYGLVPCWLVLFLLGTPARRRRQARARAAAAVAASPDGRDDANRTQTGAKHD